MSGSRLINAGLRRPGRRFLAGALVFGLAFAGPAALGAWVARPFDRTHAARPALVLAQAQTVASDAQRGGQNSTDNQDVAVGMLFTNGAVEVTALGQPVKVDTAVYPYLGGEQVAVPPDGMAVLRLGESGLVFFCGGSTSAFAIENGQPVLTLQQGSVRLISASPQVFAVRAGQQALTGTPARTASDTGASATGRLYAAEVARDGDTLKVLPLEGQTAAGGEALVDGDASHAIWSVRNGASTRLGFPTSLPTPTRLAGPVVALLGGGDYLCRTDELALVLAQNRIPPADEPIDLPPFLAPPGAPPLALASPDVADVFDPNALPPPAAGPGAPEVIVPAPSLPVTGTGGGALATPE